MGFPANAQTMQKIEPIEPLELSFDERGLTGPGAESLISNLKDTQFVMIGEDHGFADAPRLVTAFAAETKDLGFANYVIEVGPFSTEWIAETLRTGGPKALSDRLKGRPLAIPFLNLKEEAEAAMAFLGDGKLWGVDQEFIGSPLIHFEILQTEFGVEKSPLGDLAQSEREAFASGKQADVFFARASEADWDELRKLFEHNGDAIARIEAMEASAAIYRPFFFGQGLDNNLDRVAIIRKYFLSAYRRALEGEGRPPRAILKFGATHAGKGSTPVHTFDLGSLIEGLAASHDLEALHVAYIPIGGSAVAIFPSAEGSFTVKPARAEGLVEALALAGVRLESIYEGDGHYVIDLEKVRRALGDRGLSEIDPNTRFTVLGFDHLITTNLGAPATPLAY